MMYRFYWPVEVEISSDGDGSTYSSSSARLCLRVEADSKDQAEELVSEHLSDVILFLSEGLLKPEDM